MESSAGPNTFRPLHQVSYLRGLLGIVSELILIGSSAFSPRPESNADV